MAATTEIAAEIDVIMVNLLGFLEVLSDILFESTLCICFFEELIIFRSYLINASSKPYGR